MANSALSPRAARAAPALDYALPVARSPWPRALAAALVVMSVGGVLLLKAAVLGPSYGARVNRSADACYASLHSISEAIQLYAVDHAGKFPDTLESLYPEYVRDVRTFRCPSSGITAAAGATPEAVAADLAAGGHVSYVYVGAGLDATATRDTVVAFDLPGHDPHSGVVNVLFADGRVERLRDARPLLAQYRANVHPLRLPPAGQSAQR